METPVELLTGNELYEELRCARDLAKWAMRNDEGIARDLVYRLFHKRKAALESEALRRGITASYLETPSHPTGEQ